ncbi:hypothetical protein MHL31_09020 [Lutibacter sp. A80]|uniref:hypothetical protein n=1 Tax=Lutibacter sp. A80 TaxID=2918453 RepID=UPI001F052ED1|nr:hypothetical protein [Lutibacter sp. A80]UMB59221.1 hypothetical protein MHL31_09020 [Lutibacter sp. A80]
MATIESITITLYNGLYPYVANRNKKAYREEFEKRKTFNTKFALEFFPKYIDFEKWSKNPKDPYDMLLINYWMIEVPIVGLKYTNLYGSYLNGNRILNKHLKNKTNSPIKIRNIKKKKIKPTKAEIPILSESLLELLNEKPKKRAKTRTKTRKIKSEFNNKQMLLHFADITDEIELKLSKTSTDKKEFNILFNKNIIPINSDLLVFALAYFELEKKYRLEAKSLMTRLLPVAKEKDPRYNENDLKIFFKEIVNQKKYLDEKEKFKKRVVWIKK